MENVNNNLKTRTPNAASAIPGLSSSTLHIGILLPLNMAMDLVICCITDVFPSMALIYESPETTLMTGPPCVPTKDCLMNAKMFAHVYLFIDLVFMYGKLGKDPVMFPSGIQVMAPEYTQHLYNANSVYFVALVIMQICGNLYESWLEISSLFIMFQIVLFCVGLIPEAHVRKD
ncbi:hypothetical protein HDU77_005687 [Chytriomyces hyalinus]|nr:hypothetical protein HDU77_005687 [Chytriomyces hyalinus]